MELLHLPARRFGVRRVEGSLDDTRRPLYQHMIMNELVHGPSLLRLHDDGAVDVMIQTVSQYPGDDYMTTEVVPEGVFAVRDFEGTEADLATAWDAFVADVEAAGHKPVGARLQVHLMDPLDGVMEQQLQVRIEA